MKMKNKKRRGATVAELMVVIAVLAIAATMVVSFSAMTSGTTKLANAKLEALNEIRLAESAIEGFIESNANENREISRLSDEMLSVDGVGTVKFLNGFLSISYNEGTGKDNVVIQLESVTSITFDIHGSGSDVIYYCHIGYNVGETGFTYTFCVNPYVGEQISSS